MRGGVCERASRLDHLELGWIPPQDGVGRSCDQTGVVGVGVGGLVQGP